ncbi:MAG: ABC transporter ATP-binding protein [bacterium]|nr:ABC transporter ATP-binding protein [bacterium]
MVSVRGLVRTFGQHNAVDGLDLEIRRGECLGLLGPNGAGKTTTLRVLSTVTQATEGEVRIFGLDPDRDGTAIRARLGVVPQEVALYDTLSARENLEFFGAMFDLAGAVLESRVTWALEVAGLVDRAESRVETFSGGMKRRLNIVVSLLHEPELVFLDEPTVGIDPQSRNHVFDMVEDIHARGTTLVYTTHQLGEVERLCDRIVVMDEGREVASGTLAELQSQSRRTGSGLTLAEGVDLERAAAILKENGIDCAVTDEVPDLEAIFLALTGKALRDD